MDSQNFETFVPVYDAIPEQWEDSRPFVVEQLKRVSNNINVREIGWYLDQEIITGKLFIPGVNEVQAKGTSEQYRTIFRKVIVFPTLSAGVNTQPHGITIDANFTLIQLWGAATNATAFTGEPIPNGADTITYDATNIIITVASNYTRGVAVIEYIQEL